MKLPDYNGGSIVNLMSSIILARGGQDSVYPPMTQLDLSRLSAARSLVLIVIDGLGYDYVMRSFGGSTLRQYIKGRITSVFPSTTASAITTFLTGTAPQQHGLVGWFTYFKEIDTVATVLPFQARHDRGSLTNKGIDAARLFGHVPVFDKINALSYVVTPERIAYSPFNVSHCGAATIRPYHSLKDFFKTVHSITRENQHPKYVYAYWPELDSIAHEQGIQSKAVSAHLAALDAAFKQFLIDMKGSGSTLIVTADHGIIDSGPRWCIELDDHPDLVATLSLPLCGERRAAYCYVYAEKRQAFEQYVRTELADCVSLFRGEELIEKGYFGFGEPHPHLLDRIGDYTLIMKANYTIKDWLPGERRHVHIGTHGGLSNEEMHVPLIVIET